MGQIIPQWPMRPRNQVENIQKNGCQSNALEIPLTLAIQPAQKILPTNPAVSLVIGITGALSTSMTWRISIANVASTM